MTDCEKGGGEEGRAETPGLEPTCEQPSAKSSLSGNPVWPNGWVMTGEGLMPANP